METGRPFAKENDNHSFVMFSALTKTYMQVSLTFCPAEKEGKMIIVSLNDLKKVFITAIVFCLFLATAGHVQALSGSMATTSVFCSTKGIESYSYVARSLPLIILGLLSYIVTMDPEDHKNP